MECPKGAFYGRLKDYLDDSNGQMEIEKLQKDLDGMGEWYRTWVMRLNVEKCKVMHFGKLNPKAKYFMTDYHENEINIEETRLEGDFGVNIGYDLKWSGHVDRMVGKANKMLGMLKRTFENRDSGHIPATKLFADDITIY